MDNDDEIKDKYLDPEQNPMILTPTANVIGTGEIEDKYLDPAANPMILGADESLAHTFDPKVLSEKIADAFPGRDEIEISAMLTIVKMASNTYSVKGSGKPLSELPLADLLMLNDFLKDPEKG